MGYIYCITNMLNGKQYVGKTVGSINKRFKQHCTEYKKEKSKDRPLYRAMRKYGIENFIVEQLIQCEPEELNSYECLFIDKLNTYKNGYNATKGGDGKILFDYQEIIKLYEEGKTMKEVAKILQCCTDTVSNVLHCYNVNIHIVHNSVIKKPIQVLQKDKDSKQIIQSFDSIADAGRWLVQNNKAKRYCGGVRQKISNCCKGKLKTAYGYCWDFK